ncbi:MAG: 3-phenylpropionate/trans-cinnamate dioxygenase ferredoxin reductase component [Pseudonocardiales bacterium]|jgi:3-phenylpropionate/trans-cinnamate dioxygenase ferredoxin reductase subunit|nr:3-phenylpropionate/trans-cinnamate dioxygenase ferredoxin reductase component [Pseudonocardiales bacterium]
MGTHPIFVIIGAGLTGAKAAQTLREEDFDGRIVLIGAEPDRPYERPPLSKGYLTGTDDLASLYVHDQSWYAEHAVELLLGRRVRAVDRVAHQIELEGGDRLDYSKLLIATGALPRRLTLPGADLDGVHHLRTVQDSARLREAIRGGGRVVVVGAGWIGLETAAAARGYGCHVTVIEPQAAPLHAALGPEMGSFFADVHRRHGVDLHLGRGVTELRGTGQVRAVVTDAGDEIPADTVIVGIGTRPYTELAEQAGLAVDNGILVDEYLRTTDPDIFAAGDVANVFHPRYGAWIRVEHWANALHGGPAAARGMLGHDVVEDRIPYFFTDQYEIGMEYAGSFTPGGYDTFITRGDLDAAAFTAFWLSDGRIVAGMHVNQWDTGIAPIQQLIRAGRPVDPARLANTSVPLADAVTHPPSPSASPAGIVR